MRRLVEINHGDPIERAFMLFVQTSRALSKSSDQLFKTLNLSTVKYIILKALSLSGGTLTPSEMANWAGTGLTNITALVARMQKEDLVTYKRSEKDKRVVYITVTEKGRDVLAQANKLAVDMIGKFMKSIDKRTAAQFEKILFIIQKNIHALQENPDSV